MNKLMIMSVIYSAIAASWGQASTITMDDLLEKMEQSEAVQSYESSTDFSEQQAVVEETNSSNDSAIVNKVSNVAEQFRSYASDELKRPKRIRFFEDLNETAEQYINEVDGAWDQSIVLRTYMLTDDAYSKLNFDNQTTQSLDGSVLFPQVAFSESSSIIYQASTSTLFVRNHADELDKLGVMLDTMGILKSSANFSEQVVIETKFVEVSDGVLEELGFQWNFEDGSRFSIFGEDGFTFDDNIGQGADDPVITPGSAPGVFPITNPVTNFVSEVGGLFSDGLRGSPSSPQLPFSRTIDVGDGGMVANGAWSALRLSDSFSTTPSTLGFEIEGKSPIDVMVHALDQNSGANVLSSPRVVTRSGEEATLRVGELHYFPEVFEGSSSQGTLVNISYEDFEETLLGIEMVVIPKVEGDQITLQLNPVIRELAGWQTYNLAPANSIYNHRQLSRTYAYVHDALTASLPIFKVRKIETEVTMNNGSTIAMGGLISEKVLSFNDKVPLLGDLPVAGRLFRNEGERSVKRNLLIFVTATIVDPNGQVHVSKSFQ